MSASASRYIPLEIQELIIDILLTHTTAHSLVCKQWRVHVYRTAFYSITLHPQSIPAFKSFLESSFSRSPIFTSIRHLRIQGQPLPASALTSILLHLIELRKLSLLSLRSVDFDILKTSLPSIPSTIRSLELSNVRFSHYTQCSEFLGRFKSLQHLIFQDLHFPSSLPYGSHEREDDGECTGSLTLRCCGGSLQKALKLSGSGVPLSSNHLTLVKFGARTRVDIDSSVLLRDLGSLLNTLEIVSTAETFDELQGSLDISQNIRLSELKFISPDRVLGTISWLPDLLIQAPSPSSLTSIRIGFASSRQFNLDLPFLLHIVNLLEAPKFYTLRVVHFEIFVNHRSEAPLIKKQISSAFERWARKCTNRIEFTFRNDGLVS